MKTQNIFVLLATATLLTSCSHRGDGVFEHFQDLERDFVVTTNKLQLVSVASGSSGGSAADANSAYAVWGWKQPIDTGHFCTNAARRIERFIVAHGGTVVLSEETPGVQFSEDFHDQGPVRSGQMVLYRLGPYRGFVSARVIIFDRESHAGQFYLEQSSLR